MKHRFQAQGANRPLLRAVCAPLPHALPVTRSHCHDCQVYYPAIPRFLLGKPSKMWRSLPLRAHTPRLRSESGRRQPSTNYSLPLHAVSLSNKVLLHHKSIHYIDHCLSLSLVVGMYVHYNLKGEPDSVDGIRGSGALSRRKDLGLW